MDDMERPVAAVMLTSEQVVDFMADIEEFHRKFGLAYEGKPRMLPQDLFEFRVKFSEEEHTEYCDEQYILQDILSADEEQRPLLYERAVQALENQLDALIDHTYVVLGTAYMQFGPKVFKEGWRRVHAANMAKVRRVRAGPEFQDSGRAPEYDVVKPPGWTPPTHADLVADHEPLE